MSKSRVIPERGVGVERCETFVRGKMGKVRCREDVPLVGLLGKGERKEQGTNT